MGKQGISITKNCLNCGKPFHCTACRIDGPNKSTMCSAPCGHAYRRFDLSKADRMFWPKVDRSGGPDACWLYYRLDKAGYGRFDRKGPYVYAHRLAWILSDGPVPEGMEVAHRCDVRACCNRRHLFLATHDENMQDCKAKGRQGKGTSTGKAKLTDESALEILKAKPAKTRTRASRRIARALSAKHGVQDGQIYAIWRREAWMHVGLPGDRTP